MQWPGGGEGRGRVGLRAAGGVVTYMCRELRAVQGVGDCFPAPLRCRGGTRR